MPCAGMWPRHSRLREQVLEEADHSGFRYDQALYITWLSEAYLLAGRKEDAVALALRTLERSRTQKERGHQAYALRLLGEIAIQRHPPDVTHAETYYQSPSAGPLICAGTTAAQVCFSGDTRITVQETC